MAETRQNLIGTKTEVKREEEEEFKWVLAKSIRDGPMKNIWFKQNLTIGGDFWEEKVKD